MMARVRQAAGLLARTAATHLRRFLSGAMVGGALFLLAVGGVCFLLVHESAFWRLATVSTLVAFGAMVTALVTGGLFMASAALRDWVEAANIGPTLSKVLFKQALGVSDKRPHGSPQLAERLEGMTVGEAKRALLERFSELFAGESLNRWLPSQGRWIARRLTGAAGWAATRAVVAHAPELKEDDAPLDLLGLRTRLSSTLTDTAIGLATRRAWAVGLAAVAVAAAVCVAVAAVLG